MRNNSVCFSGHRKIPDNKINEIKHLLKTTITDLIEHGYTRFIAGGALGFDTLAAQTVIELKQKYAVNIVIAIPCKNQTIKWKESDITTYNKVLSEADKIIYVSEYFYKGCMQKRNRYMVDNSNICVCYLTENCGGTFNTVTYAQKHHLQIINIADI